MEDKRSCPTTLFEMFAQYGDSDATDVVRPFHRIFSQAFEECFQDRYFETVQRFSIFLRVSGSIWKFESEGPERLRYGRRRNEITIDLVIPENRWRGVASRAFRVYLKHQVKICFESLVARARKEKQIINEP